MLRALVRHRPWVALAILIAAVAMKALVPAGMMVDGAPSAMTIRICDGAAPDVARSIAIPARHGEAAGSEGKTGATHDHQACPFSVLGLSLAGGADALLLALAIAFILLAGFAPQTLAVPAAPAWLRPPLRAPPLAI